MTLSYYELAMKLVYTDRERDGPTDIVRYRDDITYRVSNCATWFLKQFEVKRIEAMQNGNLLTKIEEGSSSVLASI